MYHDSDNRPFGEQERPGEPDYYPAYGSKRPKRRGGAAKIVALCLVCALAGGVAGGAGVALTGGSRLPENSVTVYTGNREPLAVRTVTADTRTQLTLPEIYSNYKMSTVGITVDIVSTNIFGQTVKGAAAGSGFVISDDGYIVTNYHVIQNANTVTVCFADGASYPAAVVGGEAKNDVAVLKIEAAGLAPVVLGDSEVMLVGEQVAAIGNPLGELTFTLTSGYVSALDRAITMGDGVVMNMLQTDTAINSGTSGGPLFNVYGEVIGITTAKYSGGSYGVASIEGIGFAIPINDVSLMIQDIMAHGYVTGKPFLGIAAESVDAAAQKYGIPAGARVSLVAPGLCADKAGVKEGDIITLLGDESVTSFSELAAAKNKYKAGDTADVTIYRGGETLTLRITFDEETAETVKIYTDYATERTGQQQGQQRNPDGFSFGWPFDEFFR